MIVGNLQRHSGFCMPLRTHRAHTSVMMWCVISDQLNVSIRFWYCVYTLKGVPFATRKTHATNIARILSDRSGEHAVINPFTRVQFFEARNGARMYNCTVNNFELCTALISRALVPLSNCKCVA
jgi:hypothetical protein